MNLYKTINEVEDLMPKAKNLGIDVDVYREAIQDIERDIKQDAEVDEVELQREVSFMVDDLRERIRCIELYRDYFGNIE